MSQKGIVWEFPKVKTPCVKKKCTFSLDIATKTSPQKIELKLNVTAILMSAHRMLLSSPIDHQIRSDFVANVLISLPYSLSVFVSPSTILEKVYYRKRSGNLPMFGLALGHLRDPIPPKD